MIMEFCTATCEVSFLNGNRAQYSNPWNLEKHPFQNLASNFKLEVEDDV